MIQEPILLVDDEEDLRLILRDALARDGYRVEEAADANQALARMAATHYPVVITDLNMPGGPTGFDLIAAVKARDPRTLCVVITGYASMETAIQAVKMGAYDFVRKPFKLEEIKAVVDRALDHARVLGQLLDYQKDLEARVLTKVQEIQDLHIELGRLDELALAAQAETSEAALLGPFLDHLQARFHPAGVLVLVPDAGGWLLAAQLGDRPCPAAALPPPAALDTALEWTWPEGYPEGHLVPLRCQGNLLGAVFLGFADRTSFHSDLPGFGLWRRRLEAALNGLRWTRVRTGQT